MRGRTISIYIPDWNPRGIKICDIQDSIVKAILVPRSKLEDSFKRNELQEPWIYFLIWEQNEIGKHKVYIWEAETLVSRIKQHNTWKDFWNIAICFTSEKKNINKAHIKYLESYCCQIAKDINKCELDNSINPTQSALTEQDKDFMMIFFDDLKIIIWTLWYPIFEETKKERKNIIYCKGPGADAAWELTEDSWVIIFQWSKARSEETNTAWDRIINMRKKLIEQWILNSEYIFTEDYLSSSTSAAAWIILWRRANWRLEWKDINWKTLDENIRKISNL